MQILKKKGWKHCLREVWKKVQRFHWISDGQVLEAEHEAKAFRYLHKYKYALKQNKKQNSKEIVFPNKIWVCWLQGIENAPLLVQKCVESIKKNSAGREVIILTHDNIAQYVEFPEHILSKYKKKNITHTHFSDILRIALLAEHGGIWIDATVLLTEPLPDYILNAPLFCFKSPMWNARIKASSWFIAARPQNKIVCETRDILYEYWKYETALKHYFVFHLFFSIVIDSCEENKQLWKEVPYYSNVNPHVLQFEMFDVYNKNRFETICQYAPVHKLTYKIPDINNLEIEGSYYDKLIKGELGTAATILLRS